MSPRVLAALLLALAGGCDWSLHRMQAPVGCAPHGATAWFADGRCDRPPPAGAIAIEAPAPPPAVDHALLARGRDRFERICAACHGLAGDGDAEVARAMTLRRPPSLVDAAAARLSDERVLAVIAGGYGLMPAYADLLAPRDRQAILHYLRALQGRDVPLAELPAGERTEAARWLR